jgi:hypothetical protein
MLSSSSNAKIGDEAVNNEIYSLRQRSKEVNLLRPKSANATSKLFRPSLVQTTVAPFTIVTSPKRGKIRPRSSNEISKFEKFINNDFEENSASLNMKCDYQSRNHLVTNKNYDENRTIDRSVANANSITSVSLFLPNFHARTHFNPKL